MDRKTVILTGWILVTPVVFGKYWHKKICPQIDLYTKDHSIKYLLYTRYKDIPIELFPDDKPNLQASEFAADKPIFVLVHDRIFNATNLLERYIAPLILESVDANVISVDWGPLANTNYIPSACASEDVGEHLAGFLWFLEESGASLADAHLIGHGLGAHAVAVAGRRHPDKVGRITALDPAAPLFPSLFPFGVSDRDAFYVEVVHTNAPFVGQLAPLGHADFYVNNGVWQQGCCAQACLHDRAVVYFAASLIYQDVFIGNKCHNLLAALMPVGLCYQKGLHMGGLDMDKLDSEDFEYGDGIYTIDTTDQWPFYVQPYGFMFKDDIRLSKALDGLIAGIEDVDGCDGSDEMLEDAMEKVGEYLRGEFERCNGTLQWRYEKGKGEGLCSIV